ncbi:MAG: alpha/beta hydrolase [Actinomycetota bacterium]|nr:alpha/beta hydrolase [Actinomycetota bacterium]
MYAPGPWQHRDVSANGARFHVVEQGAGPAVILLHGFPTFWWTWRQQITALADAGYRAIAVDMRGYGGSDHPPHGYDPFTLAADIAGLTRSLGEERAVIVGHGWGGMVAWAMSVMHPEVVAAIVPVAMPHPRSLRGNLLKQQQLKRLMYAVGFQIPIRPERRLAKKDAARVERLLRKWSADDTWVNNQSEIYRAAFSRWPTAHTSIEYHRWAVRSLPRADGRRFYTAMKQDVTCPVLHLQGADDPMCLPSTSEGSADRCTGRYEWHEFSSGHFPQEETPDAFNAVLLQWLRRLP